MLCLVIQIIIMDYFLYRGGRVRIFVPYTSKNTSIFKVWNLVNFHTKCFKTVPN